MRAEKSDCVCGLCGLQLNVDERRGQGGKCAPPASKRAPPRGAARRCAARDETRGVGARRLPTIFCCFVPLSLSKRPHNSIQAKRLTLHTST